MTGVSVEPWVGVLPLDSWGWDRGDEEWLWGGAGQSGLEGGMNLPCSRAEPEVAPWAQGQGSEARRKARNSLCQPSSSISRRLRSLVWKPGLGGRAGRGWGSLGASGPGPRSQLECP